MKRPIKEAAASRALCKKLEAAGWQTWRLETRQASGVPDIVARDSEGKLVWIETKRFRKLKDDVLHFNGMSPAQIAFAAKCERAGVPYLLMIVGAGRPIVIQSLDPKAKAVFPFQFHYLAILGFRQCAYTLRQGKLFTGETLREVSWGN